jgi:hypothetical protein
MLRPITVFSCWRATPVCTEQFRARPAQWQTGSEITGRWPRQSGTIHCTPNEFDSLLDWLHLPPTSSPGAFQEANAAPLTCIASFAGPERSQQAWLQPCVPGKVNAD